MESLGKEWPATRVVVLIRIVKQGDD